LSGPDAAAVEAIARQAVKDGTVPLHPESGSYPVRDPFRNRREFAVLLGYWWQPPPELERYYPTLEEDGAASAIADDGTERWIYSSPKRLGVGEEFLLRTG